MNWSLPNDTTRPVITAEKHVMSAHGDAAASALPETCVVFEMGMALPFLKQNFRTVTLAEPLPCFIASSECIALEERSDVCFAQGGYGAPAAVDTLETLRALGVKRILVAGMCGGFGKSIQVGDVVIPHKILSEEGTSRHYAANSEFALPNAAFYAQTVAYFSSKRPVTTAATVSTDAVYRQTFAKEAAWREMGCVGVDMEASALLNVAAFYKMPAAAILLCSDKHPSSENEPNWAWGSADFGAQKREFVRQIAAFALGEN